MKIRKGLLFREFYLNRKSIKMSLIVFGAFLVLGMLFSLSAKVGNIAKISDPDLKAVLDPFTYYAFTILSSSMLGYLMCINDSVNTDIKCGWLKYAETMPLTPAERAAHTCIALLIGYAAAVILSALSVLIFGMLHGRGFDTFTFGIILTTFFMILISYTVQTAVNYWRKDTARGTAAGVFAMYAVIFPAMYLIMKNSLLSRLSDNGEELDAEAMKEVLAAARTYAEKLVDILLIAVPIASIALIAMCFVVMKKAFERKG